MNFLISIIDLNFWLFQATYHDFRATLTGIILQWRVINIFLKKTLRIFGVFSNRTGDRFGTTGVGILISALISTGIVISILSVVATVNRTHYFERTDDLLY